MITIQGGKTTYGPNVVTDGLILYLDAANEKSYNDNYNLLYDSNGNITWTVGQLGTNISRQTIVNNDRYKIISTNQFGVNSQMRFYTGPYTNLINNQSYNLSYKYKILTTGSTTFSMSDWNDTALTNIVNIDYGTYQFSSASGVRATYNSTYNFMDFWISTYTEVEIWDVQLQKGNTYTEFTNNSIFRWKNLISNNYGILNNGMVYNNKKLFFNNASNNYSTINSTHSYLSSSSIEVLFSVNVFDVTGITSIGGYDQGGTGNYSYSVCGMIFCNNDTKKIMSSVITSSQTYRTVTSNTVMNTGNTYHVVLNKDMIEGKLELFVNGILESTNTFDVLTYSQWPTSGNTVGSNVIRISNTNSTNSAWSKYLNGNISLFKLYNRILTPSEILQNYNSTKSRSK